MKLLERYDNPLQPNLFAVLYDNEDTGWYELHFYDKNVLKEEPPVGMFKLIEQARYAGNCWVGFEV